jgi:hypothetical protein
LSDKSGALASPNAAGWLNAAPLHGKPPTIRCISSSLKARSVRVRTLPCMAVPNINRVAVSSSGASMTATRSYGPSVHQTLMKRPPDRLRRLSRGPNASHGIFDIFDALLGEIGKNDLG